MPPPKPGGAGRPCWSCVLGGAVLFGSHCFSLPACHLHTRRGHFTTFPTKASVRNRRAGSGMSTGSKNAICQAISMAGAGGIEPPNGGIKIRCLTAWLRPNSPCRGTRGRPARPLPAPPVYRGSHAISTGRGGEFFPKIAPIGISLYSESLPRLPRGRLSSPGGPNTTQRRVETTPVSWEDGGSH